VLAPLTVPGAAPPDAPTAHVIRTAGFGHGVGLSQYGAHGFARRGRGYRAILRHYYRGASLERGPRRMARVLVRSPYSTVRVRGARRIAGRRARPRVTYTVRAGPRGVELLRGRRRTATLSAPLRISGRRAVQLLGKADTGVEDGRYRGSLVLEPARGGLAVVNHLDTEQYLRGVVPAEMPSSWHPEALKAQAVAARSYALASRPRSVIYDHLPDTRSQVYLGVAGEQPETDRAIRSTAREVLTHRGEIITAFFFSTSGGRTENAENSFVESGPRPYLVSVRDPYDRGSPHHRGRLRLSQAEMERRLRGLYRGRFERIEVLRRGVSPRIVRARVAGSEGSAEVSGGELRTRLGLPDTWARFFRVVSWAAPGRLFAGLVEPRTSRVAIERRSGRRWRRVGRATVSAGGDFLVRVRRPGVLRARATGLPGPPVRVR